MMPKNEHMECLISIVMPIYNAVSFLKQAIDSLLNQSFHDFELIVVDDASTDHSLNILYSYNDPRIIILKNTTNLGNYPSRNRGMALAKGKYICVMDADDIAMPERLEVQFCFLESHPEVLACGSSYRIIGDERIYTGVQDYELIQKALLINNCFLHPSVCFRTNVLEKLGMYNESYVYASDYDFLCRLALEGPVVNLTDILMLYRWHPEQITQAHREEQIKFANRIRRDYQRIMINKYLPSGIRCHDYNLAHSWMGYIIFLYVFGKSERNISIENEADNILENVLSKIHSDMLICLENGLSGIACGLLFLLRNRYIEGEENIVMNQIDQFIRSKYAFLDDGDFFTGRGGVDFYFRYRYNHYK